MYNWYVFIKQKINYRILCFSASMLFSFPWVPQNNALPLSFHLNWYEHKLVHPKASRFWESRPEPEPCRCEILHSVSVSLLLLCQRTLCFFFQSKTRMKVILGLKLFLLCLSSKLLFLQWRLFRPGFVKDVVQTPLRHETGGFWKLGRGWQMNQS